MPDLSGVDTTNLELYLEFDNTHDDDSGNNRDQSPAVGAALYVDDGAVSEATKIIPAQQNYINTGTDLTGNDVSLHAAAANEWSVALWVRFADDSEAGTGALITRQTEANPNSRSFALVVPSKNRLRLGIRGAVREYAVTLHDNQWHHIVVTFDDTTVKLYVDNVAKANPYIGGNSLLSTIPILIGATPNDAQVTGVTNHFRGQLDEVRFYSEALTNSDVNLLYRFADHIDDNDDSSSVQPTDLELHLKFEGNLTDSSINARDQTANLVNDEPTYVGGQVDSQAANFEADNSTHIATGVEAFGGCDLFSTSGQSFSVSVWVKATDATGIGTVISRRMSSTGFRLQVTNGGANLILRGQLNNYTLTGNNDEEWHHYAVTWNGTAAAFYYDGVAQSAPTNGSDTEGSEDIYIGVSDSIGGGAGLALFFDASMDDLRLYSRALSATDVAQLADLAPARFVSTLTIESIAAAVASMKVVFGGTPTSFVAGDVTVDNGSVSNVAGSGTTYTFDVTAAADGVVSVSIAADEVVNAAGAGNAASDTVQFGVGGVSDPTTGGLLRFDRTAARSFDAQIIIGPVPISPNAIERSIISMARVTFGSSTNATGTLAISTGMDGEDAVTRADDDGDQWSAGITSLRNNNGVGRPRQGGHAATFKIDVSANHCVLEQINLELEPGGKNRGARYVAS